jgi:hypothetical protein
VMHLLVGDASDQLGRLRIAEEPGRGRIGEGD